MGFAVSELKPNVVLQYCPLCLAEVTELLRERAEIVGHQAVVCVVAVSQFQREREVRRAVLK